MPELTEESSLDRFLQNRGGQLLGHVNWRTQSSFVRWFGLGWIVVGLGALGTSIAIHNPEVGLSSIGPLVAGSVNILVSQRIGKRLARNQGSSVTLTREARLFLAELMREAFGWGFSWGSYETMHDWSTFRQMRRLHHMSRRGMMINGLMGKSRQKPAAHALPDDLFKLLDPATFEYNRIFGCLASTHPSAGTIAKMESAIVRAADETIGDVLHQAYLIQEFPESSGTAEHLIEQHTASLHELADRLEALQTREPSISDRLSPSTALESVLEDLRLEQLARTELSGKSVDEQTQEQNKNGA